MITPFTQEQRERLNRDVIALERTAGTVQDLCITGEDAERHVKNILSASVWLEGLRGQPIKEGK